jgi:plastocyanin
MKTGFFLIIFIFYANAGFAKIWTITNSGLSFSPSTITINPEDTVVFSIAGIHQVREVNETDWNANGSTALPGGFETPSGGGMILPSQLGLGTHFYVCVPHAESGIKGKIIVQTATGINENHSKTDRICVYPNPAVNLVTIKTTHNHIDLNYCIRNLSGHQVLFGKLSYELTIVDITRLPSGIYMILTDERQNQSLKFIKN